MSLAARRLTVLAGVLVASLVATAQEPVVNDKSCIVSGGSQIEGFKDPIVWQTSLESAMKKAKAEDKPVLVVFNVRKLADPRRDKA